MTQPSIRPTLRLLSPLPDGNVPNLGWSCCNVLHAQDELFCGLCRGERPEATSLEVATIRARARANREERRAA